MAKTLLRRRLLVIAGTISVLFVGTVTGYKASAPIKQWRLQRFLANERAEALAMTVPTLTAQTLEGEAWSLQEYRGKVVLIEFWKDHCGPCIGEVAFLQDAYDKFADRGDFAMVGIALDASRETVVASVERFNRRWIQLHEPNAGWDSQLRQALPVRGVPSIILIDRDGSIIDIRLRGYRILTAVANALGSQSDNLIETTG